jgi:hypothetical protein
MVLLFGASFDWFDKLTTGKLRAGCVLCLLRVTALAK